jgi:hypothetical protein
MFFFNKTNIILCARLSVLALLFIVLFNCSSPKNISSASSLTTSPPDRRIEFLVSQITKNNWMISFKVPPCDPISETNLIKRSFTYDVAISAIVFSMLGDHGKANDLLAQIEKFISPENGIEFSYDAEYGSLGMHYVRTGAVAWLGYSLVYANRLKSAQVLADFLLTRKVSTPEDLRYGLFRGGFGEIKKDTFIKKEIEWISTEHNIDAYFFFRDLGFKLKNLNSEKAALYSKVAWDLKQSILDKLWDFEKKLFFRGMGPDGLDQEKPLDVQTWGSLFLTAIAYEDKARSALKFARKQFFLKNVSVRKELIDENKLNCQYECSSIPYMGFKPYSESPEYKVPPKLIWTEGTYGYNLAAYRLGISEPDLEISQKELESCSLYGGVLQATETRSQIPYEFHTWESTASTVWSLFNTLEKTLPESLKLWATDKTLQARYN